MDPPAENANVRAIRCEARAPNRLRLFVADIVGEGCRSRVRNSSCQIRRRDERDHVDVLSLEVEGRMKLPSGKLTESTRLLTIGFAESSGS